MAVLKIKNSETQEWELVPLIKGDKGLNGVFYNNEEPQENGQEYNVWVDTKLSNSRDHLNYPIGFVYIQFPGMKSPKDLDFKGKWYECDFEGAFFRSEGGKAKPFNYGPQEEATYNILERYYNKLGVKEEGYFPVGNTYIEAEGVFKKSSCWSQRRIWAGSYKGVESHWEYANFYYNKNLNRCLNGIYKDDNNNEIRPRNMTIKIWERLS